MKSTEKKRENDIPHNDFYIKQPELNDIYMMIWCIQVSPQPEHTTNE
jgi:hypothetical protein